MGADCIMRGILVLAAVMALAVARPETYREKEDFQYSRSSSDDGTKSGYYGAQRGNMGGNYERAHNMDLLAQHQMGGLMKNVEGELGDGANQKSGSVFSAANSRGVYGSGHYDLSNLAGRNFQEGTSFGGSQSHSSSSSTQNAGYGNQYSNSNTGYRTRSQNSGYDTHTNSEQTLYGNNMQSADSLQSASEYDGSQAPQESGRHSFSGDQGQSAYDQDAANSHVYSGYGASKVYGSKVRLVSLAPVRVYVRPGGKVAIPVAAQTYDSSHGSASTFDQNAINSESEDNQNTYKPTNNAKHYESKYSYRKEWEKHDNQPITVAPFALPTVNPYPSNSELYEDTQVSGSGHQQVSADEAQNVHSHRHHSEYNIKSGSSSQSNHQAVGYNQLNSASETSATSNAAGSSAYTHGGYNHDINANLNTANLINQVEDFSTKPKSYQSSYSYHKSWERQGDPYIIKPASNGLYTTADTRTSQRLTSSNQGSGGYGTHQLGVYYNQGQRGHSINGVDCDCDENGHIRVARSYVLSHDQDNSKNIYEDQGFGQQSQNLEDLFQQSQNKEDFGQQSQKLEDLGQQPQNIYDFGQQSQKSEDLGQQPQNLHEFGQQSVQLEDLGQQPQNFDDFSQQLDVGQQTQDAEQETQSQWDTYPEQAQQTQNQFDRIEDLEQQQTLNQWEQQTQTDLGQQTQNTWSTLATVKNGSGRYNTEHLDRMDHSGYNQNNTNTFQSQESTFERNPPNINQLESSQGHIESPYAHVIFNEHRGEQEKTDSDKVNIVTDLSELEKTGQQTYTSWDHFQENINQNNPVYVPVISLDSDRVPLEQPNWPQYLNEHISTHQIHYTTSDHSTHSTRDITHNNSHESGSTSLTDLWSLLDNMEKNTTSADRVISNHKQKENNNSKYDSMQNINPHTAINTEYLNVISHSTTESPIIETTVVQYKLRPLEVERVDIGPESKQNPQEDIGRGDIGPDDSLETVNSMFLSKPLEIIESKPSNSKPYKTLEEIETLSLTKETNKTTINNVQKTDEYNQNVQNENNDDDSLLSVLSLGNQKHLEHNDEDNWKLHSDIDITTNKTPKSNYSFVQSHFKEKSEDMGQQNTEPQLENVYYQGDDQNQRPCNQFESFDHQNGDQENIHHHQMVDNKNQGQENQLVSNGQQSVNLYNQNSNHFGYNLETGREEITTGQEDESINQHSLHQFEELDQHSENLGQEHEVLHDFGQQNEGFHQENIHDFGQHEQIIQESLPEFDHQNQPQKKQQLDNWGQYNKDLKQQIEDLRQQVQSTWKPSEDIQKETEPVEIFVPMSGDKQESKESQYIESDVASEIVTKMTTNVEAPLEPPVTEKIGFWNKVGSKFTNAKDKVASWFSRS